MGLSYPPKVGQIVECDFKGFSEPEMVKRRPVIVIAGQMPGRSGLATVVALSTVEPEPMQAHHLQIPRTCLPRLDRYQSQSTWLKGDMVYTVSVARLDLIRLNKGPDGKRSYFMSRLGRDRMKEIYACVLSGLNLGHLGPHL